MSVTPSILSATQYNPDSPKLHTGLEDAYELTDQESMSVNKCVQNLHSIGNALKTYEKDYDIFPEWLSNLYPKYLSDSDALICPADEDKGIPIIPYDTDPNPPVSYNYDCNADYYKQWLKKERLVHHGTNPIVRCPHHANPDSEHTLLSNLYLNLSFSNTIFVSEGDWRKNPIKMHGNLEAAIAGYEKALELVPEDPNFFYLYIELIRLYKDSERQKDIENLISKFRSIMKPHDEDIMRFRDYFIVLEMLRACNKHNEALQLCEKLEKTEQDNPWLKSLYRELAVTHEELGNIELADTYYDKYDSKRKMVGKLAPDFSATDMDGHSISLKDFRGKVVLLDFWATWCGPCIGEMPNVKKIYDTYHEFGLEVIGISLDKNVEEPRDFLNKYQLPWIQIFDCPDGSLKKLFRVRGIPSLWLIDRDGMVISYGLRGASLKKHIDEIIFENFQK